MTKHIIKNYDQLKAHLTVLSKGHNSSRREYLFAVGDAFNECLPPGTNNPKYKPGQASGVGGGGEYQRRIGLEIDRLLDETGTDLAKATLHRVRWTADKWPKDKRVHDVCFGVYQILGLHQDLISDGMTQSKAWSLIRGAKDDTGELQAALERNYTARTVSKFNRTQALRISANTVKGVLRNDDGSELTEEEKAIVGEAYANLDALCERKGVSMYEEELVAA